MELPTQDAIVIRDVVKTFRKSTIRKEHTTLKSELVRWLRRQPRKAPASGAIPALRGINLTIPRGKTLGLIGRNGSGKSTLLKLITGIYSPTSGSIDVNGRISALLDLGAGFHPDFSGRENILINGIILGMTRAEVKARMDEIIEFSELGDFIDEPVRTYSSGMYMRLAFAVATHVDPEILIVDEILAVGDEHFSRKSRAKMNEFKQRGKTIVLVTHDLGTLESWCDSAAWIDAGRIREQGAPAEVIRHYRRALELAEASGVSMVSPALHPDGGALPTLTGAARSTPPAVEITAVSGSSAELSPDDALEFRFELLSRDPEAKVAVAVELCREDGLLVYSTDTHREGMVFDAPLPERFALRLVLDRVGLTAGGYTLRASVLGADGAVLSGFEGGCGFTVSSSVGDTGVTRPPHRWVLAAAATTPASLLSVGR
jgi:lipopolysaccharide transport system ATP-binding protein